MQIVCKSRAQIPCENSVSNPVRAPVCKFRARPSVRVRQSGVKNAKNRRTPVRLYADAFAQLFLPDPALTGAGLNRNGRVLRNRLDILKRAAKRYLSSFAAESSDCSGCMSGSYYPEPYGDSRIRERRGGFTGAQHLQKCLCTRIVLSMSDRHVCFTLSVSDRHICLYSHLFHPYLFEPHLRYGRLS